MKKIKKYLLAAVMLVLGVSFLWQQQPKKSGNPTTEYRYQVDQPRVVSYSAGEKRWDLLAKSILEPKTEEKDTKKTILKNVKNGKLFKDGELKYRLDADKIIYYKQSKNVTLVGNVKLKQVNGQEIITSRMEWIDSTELLKTNSGVRIELNDGGTVTAQKMKLNVKDDIVDLDKQVETSFVVKGADNNEE